MQITLWSGFKKRVNSTKIPASAGETKTAHLKENCSINNPIFILTGNVSSYDYCSAFGNYYFVTDIVVLNRDTYQLYRTIDVMATFRADILNYTAYVKRSASSYNNMLNDSMIPSGQQIVQNASANTLIDNELNGAPTYALRTISSDGVRTYMLSYVQLRSALDSLFTKDNIIDVFSDAFTNFFVNPQEHIVSLMFFRANPSNLASGSVKFGWYDTDITADYVDLLTPYKNYTVTISKPARYYNDFRDLSNEYTHCELYLAGYGAYHIDATLLQCTLSATYTIDFVTGGCTIKLMADSNLIATLEGKLGAQIQLNSDAFNLSALTSGIIEAGTGIAMSNPVTAVKGVADLSQSLVNTQPSSNGTNDCISHIVANPASIICHVKRMNSAGIPNTQKGRPLCQNVVLSTLSGYCECLEASVETSADEPQKTSINNMLNTGFYIE